MIRTALLSLLLWLPPVLAGQYNSVISPGDPMPSFQGLPATDGSALSSGEIDEAVVVLVSLANHCPWVKGMDGDLVGLVESLKGSDARVIGFAVNHREDDRLPAMKAHAAAVGYNFTYVFDESQELGRQLGATRTPEYFVFGPDRTLVYTGLLYNSPAKMNADGSVRHINGEPSEFYVHDAVVATLAGEPYTPAETRAHGCSVKYQ